MAISVPKSKTMVFSGGGAQHAIWKYRGQVLEQVDQYEYFGLFFSAQCGVQATFPSLRQKIFAAWAHLKRQ